MRIPDSSETLCAYKPHNLDYRTTSLALLVKCGTGDLTFTLPFIKSLKYCLIVINS
jgi:hypothetical protein